MFFSITSNPYMYTIERMFGAVLRNWANMMAMHRLMFFGITINPSMYTQGEFWRITQELGQHDGQTSPNGGENHLPMGFERFIKTIL